MDLKPCPFCGGEPYFDHDDDEWTWIECVQCHVATNQRISAMEDCKPLLAEAWNRRALPPEPRTCETCGTGCPNRGAKVVGLDLNESKSCPEWTPRSPQSADVDTVRSKIELAIKFGLPIDARMALKEALAALDRIAGVLH